VKHIVLITPGFAANPDDTVTIPALRAFAAELARQHVKVTVLALEYPARVDAYEVESVTVYSCGGNNRPWPLKLLALYKAARLFAAIHTAQPVTHIHSFWWQHTVMLGNYLAGKYKLPHLTTLMGQDALRDNMYARWLPVKNNMVVALSAYHAKHFTATFAKQPTVVIPWGIDKNDSVAAQPIRDIDVLGVGWLSAIKNYKLFVEVIAIVAEHKPDVKCVLAGDGEERTALQQQIAALGLENTIKITGLLPRIEVLQLMARSNVLLHTSGFESYGYVFAEAWVNGMQVVSTPVGIADDTNAHTGNTAGELANKLLAVLNGTATKPAPVVPLMADTVKQYMLLYNRMGN
jgi:glycosyltransferase involved in cell wall biosynthesis